MKIADEGKIAVSRSGSINATSHENKGISFLDWFHRNFQELTQGNSGKFENFHCGGGSIESTAE
jgi:hypothetical protein